LPTDLDEPGGQVDDATRRTVVGMGRSDETGNLRDAARLLQSGTVEKPSPRNGRDREGGGCGNVSAAFGSLAPRSSSTTSDAFLIALVPRCVLEPDCAATPPTCSPGLRRGRPQRLRGTWRRAAE
jgi:hypothetical protein